MSPDRLPRVRPPSQPGQSQRHGHPPLRGTQVNAEHEIDTRWTRQFMALVIAGLVVAVLLIHVLFG